MVIFAISEFTAAAAKANGPCRYAIATMMASDFDFFILITPLV